MNGGIYIHIPFCSGKCPYCDFYSLTSKSLAAVYTDAVTNELSTLERCRDFLPTDFKRDAVISSVYIGGGTPSELTKDQLGSIINAVKDNFTLTNDAEITVECNPSSAELGDKIHALKQCGVNRISFGMQSAVDEERKRLGRKSCRADIEAAVFSARDSGIDNISLDVMLGIPAQTGESLKETLSFAVGLGVPHISAYMLKLEEGTFFAKNAEKLSLPDDDTTADLYLSMCAILKSNGYEHYEISNFAKRGALGRHNMKYWTLDPYLGIGPAAHSFIDGKRFYFERDINKFIAGAKPVYDCEGGGEDEKIMLGLRTCYGAVIPANAQPFCERLVKNGLARKKADRLILTDSGMLVSNSVISEILSETGL